MDFCEEIETLLGEKDYGKVEELIFNPENQPKIQGFGMDLITRICECGLAFCLELDSLRVCQDILMHVAKTVRPKEALIGLLEQAEIFVNSDSNKFSSLLAPLQFVMLSLPKKREHSFSWVLSILNSHMRSQHKYPAALRSKFVRGREALAMEESKEIKDALQTYREFCNFYEPFVKQFGIERDAARESNDTEAASSILRQQTILRDHLVQLFGDPLLYFDLHWEQDSSGANANQAQNPMSLEQGKLKTDARLIVERLMGFLRIVDQTPGYYYDWASRKMDLEGTKLKNKPIYCGNDNDSDDSDSDECNIDFSSVVNYHYMIYVEHINDDTISNVLSPLYVFISTTRLMSTILGNDKAGPIALFKCFSLAKILIKNLDAAVAGLRLESELLETPYVKEFVESVAYHTVYCQTLEVRKEGLQILKDLLWKFDPRGRYDYIMFVFNRIEHDGIRGYIITQLKDCIRIALDTQNTEMMEYFTGKFLLRQLRLTCYLKQGATTDLMDNREQILSALNLILYLGIRDKTENATGICEALPEIDKMLLEPLIRGLDLSRAHYRLRLQEMEDEKTFEAEQQERKKLADKMDIVLNDDIMSPEISIEEQKRTLNSALGVFDIMNGIVARVNEVCNILKQTQKLNSLTL